MEETKELQTTYKIFRYLIYMSLIVEFFEYAINPELLDYWGGIRTATLYGVKWQPLYSSASPV